jgi:tetratricopeptide (TPR) repeat protein
LRRKDPRYIDALKKINRLREAISLIRLDMLTSSDPSYKKQLRINIENAKEHIGWLLIDCGEYEKGFAMYSSLPWKTHGEHKYKGMLWALIEMKNYDEALRLLKKGMKRFPKSSILFTTKGVLYGKTCNDIEALQCFECALQLDPYNRHALYNKAVSLNLLGYYEDAASVLHDLMEVYPDEHDYLIEMGYSHFMTGYPEDALKFYREAQAAGCMSPNMYCGLYCIYRHLGLQNDALNIAQLGLNESPDEPAMYETLGECYFERGWIDDAKTVLKDGIKKCPEDDRLKELLKRIEDETDNPDKGKKPPPIGLGILLIMLLRRLKEKHAGQNQDGKSS